MDSDTASKPEATWSLEARLRARLLGTLVALWLGGAAVALLGLRHETGEVLDSALVETAQRLLVLPSDALGDDDEALIAEVGEHEEHVIYQVFDRAGRLRLRSHQAPTQPLAAGADGLSDSGDWRIARLTRDDGARRVVVAESLGHRSAALAKSSGWLLAALLALLPMTAAALHLSLKSSLRSLKSMRTTLASRAPHDLRPLRAPGAPRELAPLLATVNALLERVRSLVEAERLFAARSAHELRTPLAAARAQAQRLLAETGDAAAREHARRLVAQLDRLARLATRLLQIARIESGVALARDPVDLAQLAQLVADEFAPARASGRLLIEAPAAPAIVPGDVDALAIALRNLIDNALKHGGEAAPVRVRVTPWRIDVVDAGPGIDAAAQQRMKRPFERGAGAALDGVGLGLGIVETIARQSAARFELQSPLRDGRGLMATLRFDPS